MNITVGPSLRRQRENFDYITDDWLIASVYHFARQTSCAFASVADYRTKHGPHSSSGPTSQQ